LRAGKCLEAKAKGYRIVSYISSRATIFDDLSANENCFILEDNTIQPFVRIGDNVTLWSGNHIGHHSVIGNNVFITSHVVISGRVVVGENCFIGVNATVRDHVKLANHSLLAAGSLINKDTEAYGVYTGTPAQKSAVPSNRIRI
jgi:sugar O-acyltransferase (sialic acid O-acetyltransferase NeuD family)